MRAGTILSTVFSAIGQPAGDVLMNFGADELGALSKAALSKMLTSHTCLLYLLFIQLEPEVIAKLLLCVAF